MNYNISANMVELFRACSDADTIFGNRKISPETLINSTIHKTKPNKFGVYGKAFKQIINNPTKYRHSEYGYLNNGMIFDFDDIENCRNAIPKYSSPVENVKAKKEYNIAGEKVTISINTDMLSGTTLHQIKTTKFFDYDNYANNIQWRILLDVFEATDCIYNVFVLTDKGGKIRIENTVAPLLFQTYDNIQIDIETVLKAYIEFIKFNDLERHFV